MSPHPADVAAPLTRTATLSVVIPAHDEERPLARTLSALAEQGGREVPEIVVVANGCTDGTADVARAAGVRVVELAEPSKAAALTAGDQAASFFPRIYLDADIVLAPGTLDAMADALRGDDAVVAAPRIVFDVSRSSWPVRAFYDAYQRIPYIQEGLVGLGVYGLSERGRARFGSFPRVTGDDLFVQRLFDVDERVTTDGEFVVAAPRDLRNLLKVRTRTARGNAEMTVADAAVEQSGAAPERVSTGPVADDPRSRFGRTTSTTVVALVRMAARRPRLVPSVVVYVLVTIASRLLAKRGRSAGWQRDASTR